MSKRNGEPNGTDSKRSKQENYSDSSEDELLEVDENHEDVDDDEKPIGKTRSVIVIIDEATLEAVKTSKGSYELLNCDDHLGLHKKLKKDPSGSRPDICHQMMLAVLDSPLNKAGHVELLVRTNKNVLIRVSPHLRIPRTFKRFSGLMVQLLHKMKIRAADGNKTLLKVVKNPITRHLPPNARVFGASVTGTLVNIHDFVPALKDDEPVVFVLGGFAHGHVAPDYAEAMLSFSEYPLSGACAVGRLFSAFENKWGII